jgi:hypothetical protein
MRYLSLILTLVAIGGLMAWYLKSGTTMPPELGNQGQPAPQQVIKQAEDAARSLQQTLQQQEQQAEQLNK